MRLFVFDLFFIYSTPLFNQQCNKVFNVFPHFKNLKFADNINEQNKNINWRRLLSEILYWYLRNYQRQRGVACCSKFISRLGFEWKYFNFWFQKSFICNFNADQYVISFNIKHWIRRWSLWKQIFRNFRTSHKNFL